MASGASLSSLEDACLAIAQSTRLTYEALARGSSGAAAATGRPSAGRDATLFADAAARIERALANQTLAFASRAQGLARQGMAGTAEQAGLDMVNQMLARELAGVFKPVTQAMGYAARNFAELLSKMNGAQQNRTLGLIGGAIAGNMLMGGPQGIAAGLLLGPVVMRSLSGGQTASTDASLGAAGGALIGARFGPYGAVIGGTIGAAAGGGMGDYYRMYSRESAADIGDNMFSRGMSFYAAAGATLVDALSGGSMREHLIERGRMTEADRRIKPPEAKREVTPFSAEMSDAGGLAMRLQEEVVRKTAGDNFKNGGPFQPFMDVLIDIVMLLMRIANVPVVDPRSATEARD